MGALASAIDVCNIDVLGERWKQLRKWGEQSLPDGCDEQPDWWRNARADSPSRRSGEVVGRCIAPALNASVRRYAGWQEQGGHRRQGAT